MYAICADGAGACRSARNANIRVQAMPSCGYGGANATAISGIVIGLSRCRQKKTAAAPINEMNLRRLIASAEAYED
jgi:hypothetical protein